MDEFSLIERLTRQGRAFPSQTHPDIVVGQGDDTAVLKVSSEKQWLVSCDTMVEGVHFTAQTMAEEDIGYKALAANVSDIAAMGGIPRFATVSLSMPASTEQDKILKLYQGLYECAELYQVAIVGGDTTLAPNDLTIGIQIIGEVEAGRAIRRSGAKDGDVVFVTGWPGRSAAGLHYLLDGAPNPATAASLLKADHPHHSANPPWISLVYAHQRPLPSIRAGRILLESGACHALNDISDGTASEAWEIAEASGLGIILWEQELPIHPDVFQYAQMMGCDAMEWVLYGGEDYQLIGTASASEVDGLKRQFSDEGLPFFVVGKTSSHFQGVRWIRSAGKVELLPKRGYNHFKS